LDRVSVAANNGFSVQLFQNPRCISSELDIVTVSVEKGEI
jgi:hypothetical protein